MWLRQIVVAYWVLVSVCYRKIFASVSCYHYIILTNSQPTAWSRRLIDSIFRDMLLVIARKCVLSLHQPTTLLLLADTSLPFCYGFSLEATVGHQMQLPCFSGSASPIRPLGNHDSLPRIFMEWKKVILTPCGVKATIIERTFYHISKDKIFNFYFILYFLLEEEKSRDKNKAASQLYSCRFVCM